jgi:hypothetical protein
LTPEPRAPAARSILHITNGDIVNSLLGQTTLGGTTLAWQDPLHEGPVPLGSRVQFRATRATFLSEAGWGGAPAIQDGLARRDERFERALRDREHVVLWFEHDLYDQLQLLDVLSLAARAGFDPERLELIQIGSFPGRPAFNGLGQLAPHELESLWPERLAVSTDLAARASAAWDAVRAEDPRALAALAGDEAHEGLPHLAAALRRLVEELPGATNGLSRSERHALESLAAGPLVPTEAFARAQSAEAAPFLGDSWFFRRLAVLGGSARPLVQAAGGAPVPLALPLPLRGAGIFDEAEVELTLDGRAVLAGKADCVALAGIDRWVGGTHLRSGAVWRWDASRTALLPPG